MKRWPIGIIAGLAVLLAFSLAGAGYLYQSNQTLKGQLIEKEGKAEATDDSLAAFKEELALMKEDLEKSQAELLNPLEGVRVRDETGNTDSLPEAAQPDAAADPSLPKIAVEPTTADLGTISQADGPVKATYKISNQGGSDLNIISSFSSCGCTTAPIENKVLAPGKSVNLDAEYDPNYFKGLLGQGEIEKRITIISNDPNEPFYKIYLKVNVTP